MLLYSFILKDNHQKSFNSFFLFLFFLHLAITSFIFFNSNITFYRNVAATAFLLCVIILIVWFLLKKYSSLFYYQIFFFITLILFWLALKAWLPLVISIGAIGFAFFILQTKNKATFYTNKIILTKAVIKKTYSWSDIQNVILKDNLLSIDFSNNHLLQIEVIASNNNVTQDIFNHFCKQQLAAKA